MKFLSSHFLKNMEYFSGSEPESFIHFKLEALSYKGLIEQALMYTQKYKDSGIPNQGIIVIINKDPLSALAAFIGAILGDYVPAFLSPKTHKQDQRIYLETLTQLLSYHNVVAVVLGLDESIPADFQQNTVVILESEMLNSYLPHMHENLSVSQKDPDSVAFLQFSSGTTGLRKAIPVSHKQFFDHLESFQAVFKFTEHDHIVSWLPLYHDMGLVACCLVPIILKVPITLIDPEEWSAKPAKLFHEVQKKKATQVFLPNFAFNHLAYSVSENDQFDLSSIKSIVNCSEPCRETSLSLFLERFSRYGITRNMLKTCYAMAESVFAVSYSAGVIPQKIPQSVLDLQAKEFQLPIAANDFLSCGTVLPNISLRVLDNKLVVQRSNVLGQIALKGVTVSTHYLKGEIKVPVAMSDDYFLTGDLGLIYAGELFVLGRIKDTLIINGRNIFANDIELIVNNVKSVKKGRVLALAHECEKKGTEEICVLLEPIKGEVDLLGIKREVRMAISDHYGLASRVEVLAHGFLLKTSSGKLSRFRNTDKYIRWKKERVHV